MMRIGIVGTGAIASLLAVRLFDVADVVMVGRWQAHIDAIRAHGLLFHDLDGAQRVVPVAATDQWHDLPPADAVIVLTKTYQAASALARAQAIAKPAAPIVLMWNGVRDDDDFHAAFPGRVTHTIILTGGTIDTPGSVRFTGSNTIQFGIPAGQAAQFMPLVEMIRASGIDVPLFADMRSLRWSKAVINAAINPLTALLGKPNGFLATDEEARLLMATAAQEAAAVVTAMGIALTFNDAAAEALRIAQISATNRSSMLEDVTRGRQTEIDAIVKPLLIQGRKHNIATPMLQTVYDRIVNQ